MSITYMTTAHPFDPLTIDEIKKTCQLVKTKKQLTEHFRFALVELQEPEKATVLAYMPGKLIDRCAFIVVFNVQTSETFEAIVNLTQELISHWQLVLQEPNNLKRAPIFISDFVKCERIVKNDEAWRRAVKRRGLSDDDIDLIQVDLFATGYVSEQQEHNKRLVRAVCYYRENILDNAYAHPIEGVVAIVDLNNAHVVHVIDEEQCVPVPRKKHNYHREALTEIRDDVKPLTIMQPQGPSFSVNGWEVKWQKWNFHLGFTPREGIVLHQLSYQDDKQLRPLIYRASVAGMAVPYADPTANHYWKNAFDALEYGLGRLANYLELGSDCVGHVRYFDVAAANDSGSAYLMKNVICMYEEDDGILWKHSDFRTSIVEVRRSRRLVINFFATVGNYDYGFYWYLYQDGTIQFEIKLTGVLQTRAIATEEKYTFGAFIAEGLGAPTHQHFFNVRLHMMLDGEKNSVVEQEHQPRAWGHDNPHGNAFDTHMRTLKRELDACRKADASTGRYWKIINPNVKNSVGQPTAYQLMVQASPLLLAQEGSYLRARSAFASHHVWVTAYDPAERYAGGHCAQQHTQGLMHYVQENRNIENADIVLWHTLGHTHVCTPEDFPVMPVKNVSFTLKPSGFFQSNPAIDVPMTCHTRSVQDGAVEEEHYDWSGSYA